MVLLFLIIFLSQISASIVNSTSDNSTIIISLEGYNVSLPEGESVDLLYTVPPHSALEIFLTKIPSDVHFVVLQVHSYLVNVTLSLDNTLRQENSITGTNVGLIKIFQSTDLSFFLHYNSSSVEADILVSAQAYSKDAPVPGGCNMEFQVEISPFLLTTFDESITEVNFAPSAPPLAVLLQSLVDQNNRCNIKPSPVKHVMYHRYFPSRDFSKETYFSVLKSLMTNGRIMKNGALASEKMTGRPMQRMFATYEGTGHAFVVISYYENRTSVYVPSFTYGCNALENGNTCLVLTTPLSKVFCASVFFLGLFICFLGHYFFRIEMYLFGFFASAILAYIFISILASNKFALPVAVSFGLSTAAMMLLLWSVFGKPIISIILTTLTLGFHLASVIYYPITDLQSLFILDINFWGIFIGIVVTCPILMLCLAEKANIISCAFLGSYVAILSIDHYIGSNLRYIDINIIRRAVLDKFNFVITSPPFQYKDKLLCFAWAFLIYFGIKVQRMLLNNKPPYPAPGNRRNNIFRRWKSPSRRSNERTPLLDSGRGSQM